VTEVRSQLEDAIAQPSDTDAKPRRKAVIMTKTTNMTDAQLQSVMNQVISAHMGELLIRGFTEAFGPHGRGLWGAMIQHHPTRAGCPEFSQP
jgi:hypothetical protein